MSAAESLLNSLLAVPKTVADAISFGINQDHFKDEGYKAVWAIIAEDFKKGSQTDYAGVESRLTDRPLTLPSIMEGAITATIGPLCDVLESERIITRLWNVFEGGSAQILPGVSGQELLADTRKELDSIDLTSGSGSVSYKELMGGVFDSIEDRVLGKCSGVPTGFADLDRFLGNLEGGDLVIIAARPGVGKTAFACQIATNIARGGTGVSIIELEMVASQLLQRGLSIESKTDLLRLRKGRLGKDELARLGEAAGELYELPIHITDTPGLNRDQVVAAIRQDVSRHNCGVAIVDHLSLIGKSSNDEIRRDTVGFASLALKNAAKSLNIPIIGLSQIGRPQNTQHVPSPELHNLRDSGDVEQNADIVIFIHRPELYGSTVDNRGIVEVKIGKQRNGPVGVVEMGFDGKYAQFFCKTNDQMPEVNWVG